MNKEEFRNKFTRVMGEYQIRHWDAVTGTPAQVWQWIEEYAEEMCKKQRGACLEICLTYIENCKVYPELEERTKFLGDILNAPLATEAKK